MKETMKELDQGLMRAGKWFLYSKAFENFMVTILLIITLAFGTIVAVWTYKQIVNMGC